MAITISFVYSSLRRLSTSMRILGKNHIEARVPERTSIGHISDLISGNIRFLQKALRASETQKLPPIIKAGQDIYIFGKQYLLDIQTAPTTHIYVDHENKAIIIRRKTESIMRKQLYVLLSPLLKEVLVKEVPVVAAALHTPPYNAIKVKMVRSLWGSCSSNGNLSFNKRLIHYPLEVIRYVVVHEVAHLSVRNHSKTFWDLVAEYMPNYKEARKILKENKYG